LAEKLIFGRKKIIFEKKIIFGQKNFTFAQKICFGRKTIIFAQKICFGRIKSFLHKKYVLAEKIFGRKKFWLNSAES